MENIVYETDGACDQVVSIVDSLREFLDEALDIPAVVAIYDVVAALLKNGIPFYDLAAEHFLDKSNELIEEIKNDELDGMEDDRKLAYMKTIQSTCELLHKNLNEMKK